VGNNECMLLSSDDWRGIGKTTVINCLSITLQSLGYKVFLHTNHEWTNHFAEDYICNVNKFRGRRNCVLLIDESHGDTLYELKEYCYIHKILMVGFATINEDKMKEEKITELDLIEDLLYEYGFDVENYKDPTKGICQYEAIENRLKEIFEGYYDDGINDC
jgi:hypothetical protein